MTMQNPERVVTKQDLKDFYDEIYPYLGGGSGGGHEIQDSVGTTFPKRANLVFENAVVADDETNDATIVTPKGLDLELGDVSGASATQDFDDVILTWSDPSDVVIGGSTLIRWAGTTVVRKKGSAPQSVTDGTVVVTNTTRDQYASTGYRDEGLDFGDTYYYRFFPYRMSGTTRVHTTGSAVSVVIEKTALTVPSQSGTLTYNGSVQSPTWANYDSTQITISGDEDGTNADTYTATFTPKTGYKWSDDTDTAKNVDWVIGKAALTPPAVTNTSKTYNASSQSPTIAAYDNTKISVAGDSATNAGSYTVVFSLVDSNNYEWSTGAVTSVAWTIAQATGTCTLSKTSVTLNTTKLSDTVTVSNATGTFTVSSSATSVATVSKSGNTITISSVNNTNGSATVTVSIAASADGNYSAGTKTISVTASFISTTFNDNTWDTIQAVGSAGTGANYWSIGDTKTITLNGTVGTSLLLSNKSVKVFIIEFNYRGDNGIYLQGFKTTDSTPINIALCDDHYNAISYNGSKWFNMNHWGAMMSESYNTNYGGWKGCDLRYDILGSTETQPSGYGSTATTSRVGYDATSAAKTSPVSNTLMAALPSDLRSALAAWTIYTDNVGNNSNVAANVTTSVDYLPLLAEYEIHGTYHYANQYEYTNNKQKQMTYYSNGNSKVKYRHTDTTLTVAWVARSASRGSASDFCIQKTDGSTSAYSSRTSFGLAPAFRVA